MRPTVEGQDSNLNISSDGQKTNGDAENEGLENAGPTNYGKPNIT